MKFFSFICGFETKWRDDTGDEPEESVWSGHDVTERFQHERYQEMIFWYKKKSLWYQELFDFLISIAFLYGEFELLIQKNSFFLIISENNWNI